MGDILLVYKIYPEEIEDTQKILDVLNQGLGEPFKVVEIKTIPLAFGLEVIKLGVVFPDKVAGLLEKLEKTLNSIQGVGNIEVEISTLL